MIKVKFLKDKDNLIREIEVTGHADFDQYGKDIVCSAVTVYLINSLNTLTDILNIEDGLDYLVHEGYFSLDIDYDSLSPGNIHDADLILKSLEMALVSIEENYTEYVNIHYREV